MAVDIITYTREAMAGSFQIEVVAGRDAHAATAAVAALDEVTRLESLLSVFRSDSLVSRINATAAHADVAVSAEMMRLLHAADTLARITGGAFDITSYPLTQLWGRAKKRRQIPTADEIAATRRLVGCDQLILDDERCTVRFAQVGVAISFGAIGKGMALDAAAAVMERYGIRDFLLHGGMSSVLARGDDGTHDGWRIGIAHPDVLSRRLGDCILRDRALATSGTQKQFFRFGGKRWGHIIDPHTGAPADAGVASVTVFAPCATDADALSTAFFTMRRDAIDDTLAVLMSETASRPRDYDFCLATLADNTAGSTFESSIDDLLLPPTPTHNSP